MEEKKTYTLADLDKIEELNFESTPEQDVRIDANIASLRRMGYGAIRTSADLHRLFWELAHQGRICDKLMRVAIVECIEREELYLTFIEQSRQYNIWMQGQQETAAMVSQKLRVTNARLTVQTQDLQRELKAANDRCGRLEEELKKQKRDQRPKSPQFEADQLRRELGKEHRIKMQELRAKARVFKVTARRLIAELCRPTSWMFAHFDFRIEADGAEYVEWFRLMGRKINAPTLEAIRRRYDDDEAIDAFLRMAEAYNAEWIAAHPDVAGADDGVEALDDLDPAEGTEAPAAHEAPADLAAQGSAPIS